MIIKTILLEIFSKNRIKSALIVIGVVAGIWFYKDYQYQKRENKRQTENYHQLAKQDSLKYAELVLNNRELKDYLESNNKQLADFIEDQNIKYSRINSIISQQLRYRDSENRSVDLQPVLDAIKSQREIKVPVVDSTTCLVIKGYVVFKNDTLSLDITDRKFNNVTDVVSYWERRQWNFLGLKTRFLGRKQATVVIQNSCGETETVVIDKRKKK